VGVSPVAELWNLEVQVNMPSSPAKERPCFPWLLPQRVNPLGA
jgi:hypothetical protein